MERVFGMIAGHQAIVIYLVLINVITFAVFGFDKYRAVRQKWRVRERTLFVLSLIGGSAGAVLGMIVFRHKIRKMKFAAGIPLILAAQTALAWLVFR